MKVEKGDCLNLYMNSPGYVHNKACSSNLDINTKFISCLMTERTTIWRLFYSLLNLLLGNWILVKANIGDVSPTLVLSTMMCLCLLLLVLSRFPSLDHVGKKCFDPLVSI